MKRLFELVKPHWRMVVLSLIASAFVSATNGVFAWIMKNAVDDVFVSGNREYLVYISAAILIAFVVRGLATFAQNFLMSAVGAKIIRDLRSRLYGHMVYLPMSYIGTDTTGSLMSRVINDIGYLDSLLAQKVKDLFLNVGTIILLIGVALYRNVQLTFMTLVALPFAFYFVGRISRRMRQVSSAAQARMANITERLAEGITGIKVVKAFCMEQREAEEFALRGQGYYREFLKSTRLQEAAALIMELVGGLGVGFVFYYGGLLVVKGVMTSGDFFSFSAAMIMIYSPAKKLAQVNTGLAQARAYVDRVDDIFRIEREKEGSKEAPRFRGRVEFKDVTFRYDSRVENALTGVNVTVNEGEIVALVGRSGAGKTTFVDLIGRFYAPTRGSVLIDGTDISEFTSRSLRSQIGIVSQDVVLFNGSVRENISFGVQGADEAMIERAARTAYADGFITALPGGYGTQVGDSGSLLSGGQRQRISIARAVLMEPPILILDEATSSLDTESERMVQKALDELMNEASGGSGHRRTVFVIAHRLSTIERADKIIVLDSGRVAEVGNHAELLARGGLYSKLHELQAGSTGGPVMPE